MATQRTKKKSRAVGSKSAPRNGSTIDRLVGPKEGSHVKVAFGRREVEGVVVGKTITGRYSVTVDVPGADSPVTTTYAADELTTVN